MTLLGGSQFQRLAPDSISALKHFSGKIIFSACQRLKKVLQYTLHLSKGYLF